MTFVFVVFKHRERYATRFVGFPATGLEFDLREFVVGEEVTLEDAWPTLTAPVIRCSLAFLVRFDSDEVSEVWLSDQQVSFLLTMSELLGEAPLDAGIPDLPIGGDPLAPSNPPGHVGPIVPRVIQITVRRNDTNELKTQTFTFDSAPGYTTDYSDGTGSGFGMSGSTAGWIMYNDIGNGVSPAYTVRFTGPASAYGAPPLTGAGWTWDSTYSVSSTIVSYVILEWMALPSGY